SGPNDDQTTCSCSSSVYHATHNFDSHLGHVYFYASHQFGAILYNEITRFMINKGGLKSSVCSRWSSAYDCVQSVLNLEVSNAEILAKILLLVKNAIKMVESKSTTTADVFLFLIQIATAINVLEKNSLPEHIEFPYFLHPKYQEKSKRRVTSVNILIAQIKQYDIYEQPYNFGFVEEIELSQT
ncbi:23159_t:CDS:2, partial [Cetraspora pellucida]